MPSQKSHKPGGGAMISQLSKETPSMSENKSITETHWVLWLLVCLCVMQVNLRNNKTKNTKHLLDHYLERKNHFWKREPTKNLRSSKRCVADFAKTNKKPLGNSDFYWNSKLMSDKILIIKDAFCYLSSQGKKNTHNAICRLEVWLSRGKMQSTGRK